MVRAPRRQHDERARGTPAPSPDSKPENAAAPERANGSEGVRVLCVDDHAVLVAGLKAQFAIEGRLRIVGWLPSAERLLEEVACLKPGIVLLDIEMPGPDIFETADRLHHVHPDLRFVFLSAHVREGYLAAAYKCGAWGYFAKGDDLDDIVAGLMEIARSSGATFVMGRKVRERCAAPAAPDAAPSGDRRPAPTSPLGTLSSRELEVLRLIGKGLSRAQVAEALCRNVKTIDGHQERLMKKLGLGTRAELMRFAIREGLAEP